MPSKVFLSYSSTDRDAADAIEEALEPLCEEGLIEMWRDQGCIGTGDDWYEEILEGLRESEIAVLLLSEEFLSSQVITKIELPSVLGGRREREAGTVPVLLKSCKYSEELGTVQLLNDRPWRGAKADERERILRRLVEDVERKASWTLVVVPPQPSEADREEIENFVATLKNHDIASRRVDAYVPPGSGTRAPYWSTADSRPVVMAVNAQRPDHLSAEWEPYARRFFVLRLASSETDQGRGYPVPSWVESGHDHYASEPEGLIDALKLPETQGAERRRRLERETTEVDELVKKLLLRLDDRPFAIWLGDGQDGLLRHADLSRVLLAELKAVIEAKPDHPLTKVVREDHFPPAREALASIVAATRGDEVPPWCLKDLLEKGPKLRVSIAKGIARLIADLEAARLIEGRRQKPVVIVTTSPSLALERALCRQKLGFARFVLDQNAVELHVTDLTRYAWEENGELWWVTESRPQPLARDELEQKRLELKLGAQESLPYFCERAPERSADSRLRALGLDDDKVFKERPFCQKYNIATAGTLERSPNVILLKCCGSQELDSSLMVSAEESLRALDVRELIPAWLRTTVQEAKTLFIGCRLFDNDLRIAKSLLLSRDRAQDRFWFLAPTRGQRDDYAALEHGLWEDLETGRKMGDWLRSEWQANVQRLEPMKVLERIGKAVRPSQTQART